MKPCVLVVDDEVRSTETINRILDEDYHVICVFSADEAEVVLKEKSVQVILCDQRMPGRTGVEFLASVRDIWPDILRVIISGYTDSENIINAINQAGIFHYITKPWHPEQLLMVVKNAASMYQLQQQNRYLANELKFSESSLQNQLSGQRKKLQHQYQLDNIIRAENSPMNKVIDDLKDIAQYDISVMITGESGTGKELLARALHYNSQRADKPFVIENCGAMHDELLSSELFGHKKGAFTGAIGDHIGLFEKADGGTIFLDEIGDISPSFQVKLLRVLQEGEIRPLGSNQTKKINVRVIAATNRDLQNEVSKKRFRADLYYRLTTVNLHVPPLRERVMDIIPISESLLTRYSSAFDQANAQLDQPTQAYLTSYPWPGNVRELQNEIQRLLVFSQGKKIIKETLSPQLKISYHEKHKNLSQLDSVINAESFSQGLTLKERVELLEQALIQEALDKYQWNKSKVATELGLSRVGLSNKLARYGITENCQSQEIRNDD
mgnify:CR=1 FL=1